MRAAGENQGSLADGGVRVVYAEQPADLDDALLDDDGILVQYDTEPRGPGQLLHAAPDTAFGSIVHGGHAVLAHTHRHRRQGILDHRHLVKKLLRFFGE